MLKKITFSLLGVIFLFSAIGCSDDDKDPLADQPSDPVFRKTLFGIVQGYEDTEKSAYVWKGVPYAKSPDGDLRWKEPQETESWEGNLDATDDGTLAVQLSNGEIIGSEDCLNMDIYRPVTADKGLPVLVYIHGGNNQTGKSGEIPGFAMANEANCVYISLNYRLGVLGFNCLPALKNGNKYENSGNFALLDMAFALDWIKDNVKAFGGNPDNITISGFSAGGRDVMAMLTSPLFSKKFHKAIAFSGGMTIADEGLSIKVYAQKLAPLVVEDGIKGTEDEAYSWLISDNSEVRDWLYSVSADRLARLMPNASIRMSAFPHLFNDGEVIPKEAFDTTDFNSVPLMMVTGSCEFSLFSRFSPFFMGKDLTADPGLSELNFVYNYGGKLYELFNAEESAQRLSAEYENSIYTTTITFGDNPAVTPGMMIKAFHGVFVPMIDPYSTNYSYFTGDSFNTTGAKQMSSSFRSYIKNFIWNGNPNGNGLVTWDEWTSDSNSNNTLIINADSDSQIIEMANRRIDYDEVLSEMDADTTISEASKDTIVSEVMNGRWFSEKLDAHYENTSLWPN